VKRYDISQLTFVFPFAETRSIKWMWRQLTDRMVYFSLGDTCRTICAIDYTVTLTLTDTDPRRCPDPNTRIQKFIHYMATRPQWVVLQYSMWIVNNPSLVIRFTLCTNTHYQVGFIKLFMKFPYMPLQNTGLTILYSLWQQSTPHCPHIRQKRRDPLLYTLQMTKIAASLSMCST